MRAAENRATNSNMAFELSQEKFPAPSTSWILQPVASIRSKSKTENPEGYALDLDFWSGKAIK
jgi:hypothetical protein